ncbi:MAG: hypothetical protein EZS28_037622, partial [Streblomastix strix]
MSETTCHCADTKKGTQSGCGCGPDCKCGADCK